jgi:hypothetical protein
MSCAGSNTAGAASSAPIAAATRSNDRVVPYPIGALLSASLRSLLLLARSSVFVSSFF